MSAMASQITSLTIGYSTVYSGVAKRKHQSSASLAFVQGIHRWPVKSPYKGPVTWKMFPFDDVIMCIGEISTHCVLGIVAVIRSKYLILYCYIDETVTYTHLGIPIWAANGRNVKTEAPDKTFPCKILSRSMLLGYEVTLLNDANLVPDRVTEHRKDEGLILLMNCHSLFACIFNGSLWLSSEVRAHGDM